MMMNNDFVKQVNEMNDCTENGYTLTEKEIAWNHYYNFIEKATETEKDKYYDLSEKINNLESKAYKRLYNIIAKYGFTLKDDSIVY